MRNALGVIYDSSCVCLCLEAHTPISVLILAGIFGAVKKIQPQPDVIK